MRQPHLSGLVKFSFHIPATPHIGSMKKTKNTMKAITQSQKAPMVAAPKPLAGVAVQTPEVERPDIATQLAGAALFGHHLDAVNIQSRSPLIVQPKLTVGPTNDKYEQEANRVAQQVMATPAPVQRQDEMDEDEELQMKSLVQRQEELDDEDDLQMKPHVQRQDELEEDDELQMKPLVQRFSAGGFETDGDFESRLNSRRGTGATLPIALRAEFEPKFGADFSRVRIHTDAQSHQLNESIQAKAFTTGQDLFFRQGAYEPGSRGGKELIAHELTHVMQQNHNTLHRQSLEGLLPEETEELELEGGAIQAKYQPQHRMNKPLIQRAWVGRRKLGPLPSLGLQSRWIKDWGVFHEHIWFEDNGQPRDRGFHQGGLFSEPEREGEYEKVSDRSDLDDGKMRNAVEAHSDPGEYTIVSNNCQTWVGAVLDHYDLQINDLTTRLDSIFGRRK